MSMRHWLQLALTEGIGPILQSRLVEAYGSAEAACGASASQLRSIEGIGTARASKIRASIEASADEASSSRAQEDDE